MDEYERAVELELRVAELFKNRGYEARHNVWLKGRSGVKHQIDVYAVYRAPLHVDRIVVECKAYGRPVDKDRVMKLAQVVQDLGVEKGILVTTSRFTSAAIATARGLNIDLWDAATLARMLSSAGLREAASPGKATIYYVPPMIGGEEAARKAGRIIGGLMPPRINACVEVYVPYYIERSLKAGERKRKGLLSGGLVLEVEEKHRLLNALSGTDTSQECGEEFSEEILAEGAPPYGIVIKPEATPPENNAGILYYPYYACLLEKNGKRYLVAVNAVSGKPCLQASKILAEQSIYREILREAGQLPSITYI